MCGRTVKWWRSPPSSNHRRRNGTAVVRCGNCGIALAVLAARRHCVQEDRRLVVFKGFGNEFLERPSDLDYHSGFSNVRARYGCKGEELIRGLLAAAKLPGAKDGRQLLVITLDQRDKLREEGHDITVVPAWEWLD